MSDILFKTETHVFSYRVRNLGLCQLEFHWIPIKDIKNIELCPPSTNELLRCLDDDVKHFVYREGER